MTTFTKLELELVLAALRTRAEVLEWHGSRVSMERAGNHRVLLARLQYEAGASEPDCLRTGE